MKTAFALVALFSAVAGFAQSVETVEQKRSTAAPSSPASSFTARCATCSERIDGTVTVERSGVVFCCSAWIRAGSKVAARCPYSFTLPLNSVTGQYLESTGPAWHVVSRGADYSFVGTDATAMKAAFDRLKALHTVPSHFAEHFEQELRKLARPAALSAAECH